MSLSRGSLKYVLAYGSPMCFYFWPVDRLWVDHGLLRKGMVDRWVTHESPMELWVAHGCTVPIDKPVAIYSTNAERWITHEVMVPAHGSP